MKFIQNNAIKKLIIVLIVLLLFNVLYPCMAFALDIGGILMQPLYWLILGILVPVDLAFGTVFVASTGTNMNLSRSI